MTYEQLVSAIRFRWKGISSTDPDETALKSIVHHGLCDIKSRCPAAFFDDRGRIVRLPDETDFLKDWDENRNEEIPLPPELYGAIISFALWTLYVRDQNDLRDQSVAGMMRRDYLDALGIQQAGG